MMNEIELGSNTLAIIGLGVIIGLLVSIAYDKGWIKNWRTWLGVTLFILLLVLVVLNIALYEPTDEEEGSLVAQFLILIGQVAVAFIAGYITLHIANGGKEEGE